MATDDRPLSRPRIVARSLSDHAPSDQELDRELEYFAFPPAERLKALKDKITEREKVYFDLEMVIVMLDGNPESGECKKEQPVGPDKGHVPCQCGSCELDRVKKMLVSVGYAVGRLRALHGRLA